MSISKVWFSFGGRIGRRDYWLKGILPLFSVGVLVFIGALAGFISYDSAELESIMLLFFLYPTFAIYAKRWHDIGKSGWWSLLVLIPLVGFFVFIYLGIEGSEKKANDYGPQPE